MAISGGGRGIQIIVGAEYNGKDLARAQKDLNRLQAQTESTTGSLKKLGGDLKKSFSASTIIATAAVTAFAAKSVAAFSEVQDAQEALTSAFGATGQGLVDWANETAISFNLSRREALKAAQSVAVFGKAAGLAGSELESFSVSLVERAADAASFFGGSTADAVTAFGAALRGEMEPIRRYGVLLDDATLRAEALRLGLINNINQALTPAQKTQAAYNEILRQTADVEGDVERTTDSMANQLKRAQAEFDNFQVAVGETVALALKPMLEVANGLLSRFNGLPGPIKTVAVALAGIGIAALIVVPRILAIRTAFMQMEAQALASGKRSSLALMGVGKGFRGAAAGVAAFTAASVAMTAISQDGNVFTTDSAFAARSYGEALREIVQPGFFGSIGNGLAGVTDALVPHNTFLEDARAKLAEFDTQLAQLVSDGNSEEAKKQFDELVAGASEWGATIEDITPLLPGYAAATDAAAAAVKAIGEESGVAAGPVSDLATAQDKLKEAADRLSGALGLVDMALSRMSAAEDYETALDEFVKAPSIDTATVVIDAMGDLARSFDDPIDQARFVDGALGDIMDVANDANLQLKPYLEESLLRARLEAQGIKDNMLKIPKSVNVRFNFGSSGLPTGVVSSFTGAFSGYADGGLIRGRSGSPRQDNIPIMASRGEFVVSAGAVNRFGADFFARLNQGVSPLAAFDPPRASESTAPGGLVINGDINVTTMSGERADESVPRALRKLAFVAGL